jgi:hypothetical protein
MFKSKKHYLFELEEGYTKGDRVKVLYFGYRHTFIENVKTIEKGKTDYSYYLRLMKGGEKRVYSVKEVQVLEIE